MTRRPQVELLKSPMSIYEVHLESWMRGPMGQTLMYSEMAVKLVEYLWGKHRIWTTAVVTPGEYQGLRVTPNVYTTLEEIDKRTSL